VVGSVSFVYIFGDGHDKSTSSRISFPSISQEELLGQSLDTLIPPATKDEHEGFHNRYYNDRIV